MKIVFLDFDGVLNSYKYMYEWRDAGHKGPVGLDPKAVVHLNRICANAFVVVSSSWRYGHTMCELKDILREAGFAGSVRGVTPMSHEIPGLKLSQIIQGQTRGIEIDAWLRTDGQEFGVESFVILDDDSDTEPHRDRQVKTTFDDGLTADHVEQALAILERPWP